MSASKLEIRILVDPKTHGKPLNNLKTDQPIVIGDGNTIEFQIGFSKYGQLLTDISDFSVAKLLLVYQNDGTIGLEKDVSVFDNTLDSASWEDGTKQHCIIRFAADEVNLAQGQYTLYIQSNSNPPIEILDFAKSDVKVNPSPFQKYWLVPPTFNDQSFNYPEKQTAGAVIATLVATDIAGIATFKFTESDSQLSADGYFQINDIGVISITAAGVSSSLNNFLNDFESLPNSIQYQVTCIDTDGNSTTATITLNVTDVDEVQPVINPQTVQYLENRDANVLLGSIAVSDNVAVTEALFTLSSTTTSDDGFVELTLNGQNVEFRLTTTGSNSALNDFDDANNSHVYNVTVLDAAGNQATADITLQVLDEPITSEVTTVTALRTGNFSDPTMWSSGKVPMNGDNVVVGGSFTVTQDIDATIGPSDVAVTGTPAIQIQNGAKWLMAEGVKLICRGDFDGSACTTNGNIYLQMEAGSSLLTCDREATGSQSYRIMTPSQFPGTVPNIKINGTAEAPVTIGARDNGTYAQITGAVNYYGLIDAEHFVFKNLGDSSTEAYNINMPGSAGSRLVDGRLVNCGLFDVRMDSTTGSFIVQRVTFENSQAALTAKFVLNGALTGGTRLIDHVVFDDHVQFYPGKDVTVTNCVFNENYATTEGKFAKSENNFVVVSSTYQDQRVRADCLNDYYFHKTDAALNPHGIVVGAGADNNTQVLDGCVFEVSTAASDGDMVLGASGEASPTTVTLKHCVTTPNGINANSGTMIVPLGDANINIFAIHCSHFAGGQALYTAGETYGGHAGMGKVLSCIAYDIAPGGRAYIVYDVGANDNVPDLIFGADLDYNCTYNLLTGNNGSAVNNMEFTGTHSVNSINVDPQLVDPLRKLKDWDASLGGPGTAANAIAELMKMNDSDFDTNRTTANAVAYIKEGWRPTNEALRDAGHDGVTIGAVEMAPL